MTERENVVDLGVGTMVNSARYSVGKVKPSTKLGDYYTMPGAVLEPLDYK